MPLFEWSESFSVKIPSIDEQHKKLIELVNEFHQAIQEKKSDQIIEKTFNELVKFANYHFEYEEHLFQSYGYPDAQAHELEHLHLKNKVISYLYELKSNKIITPAEVMGFLIEWKDHIVMIDQNTVIFSTIKASSKRNKI